MERHDLEAAVEARRELGHEHEPEIIDNFLDRVDRELDARIDAKLGAKRRGPSRGTPVSPAIPIASLIVGAIVTVEAMENTSTAWVAAPMWVAIFLINLVYSRRQH